MTRRLDLFGRLLLIVLGSVLLLATASVTLLQLREETKPKPRATFPRVAQVGGIIDLVARETNRDHSETLRAANGVDLTARIIQTKPDTHGLRRAPRLEAELRRVVFTPTPVEAYTSPLYRPRKGGAGVEGFLAAAVARLPDGRYLTITTNGGPDPERPRLFGLPASLWMGAMATVVALLALWGTSRETRPLRDLARAARRFDGTRVTVTRTRVGAADIRRTSLAVAAMQGRVIDLLGERSLMIGAISHDLRTLLTRMLLRVASLGGSTVQMRLEADLDGMDAMIADALAFARGTTSRVHTPLDLADLAAAEIAEREMRGEKVVIDARLGDAPVIGDVHALRRVIANLLDNAVKYGRGQVRVSVSTKVDTTVLTVEDDGPGIDVDQRTAVLEPYRRGDDRRSRHLAGSGLGLAIVGQIVRAHGGTVSIDTAELNGAALTVQLKSRGSKVTLAE